MAEVDINRQLMEENFQTVGLITEYYPNLSKKLQNFEVKQKSWHFNFFQKILIIINGMIYGILSYPIIKENYIVNELHFLVIIFNVWVYHVFFENNNVFWDILNNKNPFETQNEVNSFFSKVIFFESPNRKNIPITKKGFDTQKDVIKIIKKPNILISKIYAKFLDIYNDFVFFVKYIF